jgi:hypothetical protein
LWCKKPDYAEVLAEREIGEDYVSDYIGEIENTRGKAAETLINRTAYKNAIAAKKAAAKALEAAIRKVQKAAKQKYSSTNRIALADYLIGKKHNGSRPNLPQTSQAIIARLARILCLASPRPK